MGDGTDYPSPRSEGPSGSTASLIHSSDPLTNPSIMAEHAASALNAESPRPRLSVRRSRPPPKNAAGQIYCDHPQCENDPPTFRRPCEWNKHMDKHDRPYKCMEPGCDKIQGFTYSGGLLRHQREVHKKNATAKQPLMCPYPDCNRSTGNGFTRQENLKEHLRRRHMHTEAAVPAAIPQLPTIPVEEMKTPLSHSDSLKRRLEDTDILSSNGGDDEDGDPADLRNEVKRLRRELEEKDRRLEELEKTVASLQQSIPQSTALQD